jgi:hypothetical protein
MGEQKAPQEIQGGSHPSQRLYPAMIIFTTVFQAGEGPAKAENGVIRTNADLRKFLRNLANLTNPADVTASLESKVDFEKEQLIFVALGERKSGGEAQINAVTYLTDGGKGLPPLTEVSYRELAIHGTVTDPDEQSTYPMHIIKLKKLDGETTFNKT